MPQDFAAALGAKTFEGSFSFDVVVDPASIATVTAANTLVTVPAGAELQAGDLLLAIPPSGFASALSVLGAYYVSATTFNLRLANPTAGAVDAASGTWTFIVLRK
jgi:hypothetical protein